MSEPGGTPSRSNGQWRSVRSLEQFWETMAFRQECCSGRCVGFIWVVVTPGEVGIVEEDGGKGEGEEQEQARRVFKSTSPRPQIRPRPSTSARRPLSTSYGPIPPRLPRIKSASPTLSSAPGTSTSYPNSILKPNLSSSFSSQTATSTPYYHWPLSSRGTLLFSRKQYTRALDVLLAQNFATLKAAARSSRRWVEEVGVLADVEGWGWSVRGRDVGGARGKMENQGGGGVGGRGCGNGGVNVLGVRRKRKPEAESLEGGDSGNAPAAAPNFVGGGTGNGSGSGSAEVKVLGKGLVRKKVKTVS
ncbi:hypothetical protein K432DRAFT_429313 [Lepidopterella palustris CBS 459.81]|uniref:histone acetyltransferase n=1 Tax=Lepidopterella palustris CBS 459.81 TaxID=1314670 RepID=A0A8E2E1F5_9PEZI|nr:hypothetical protein K432DRAFT_429313 [Lepidopterella palustris CBS 459.81]